MIALLRALWGLVLSAATGFLRWLRNPCGCARAIGLVLAGVCLYLALQSYQRGQETAALMAQIEQEQQRVRDRDRALAEVSDALRLEADKLEAAKAEGAQALRELADDLADATARAAEWEARYAERPATCAAALAQLDYACPSLRGY